MSSQCVVVCLLIVGLTFSGCGKDEDASEESGAQQTTAMKPAAAGSRASAPVWMAPGDQIGASASAPQGDCPEGFACTRVLFPENERVCMKPGETLAPACDASDKCPEAPKAECVDTGTTGKLCTQFCKV